MAQVLLAVGWAWQPRVVQPGFQVAGYWVPTFCQALFYDGSEGQYRAALVRLVAEQPHLQFTFNHMYVEAPALPAQQPVLPLYPLPDCVASPFVPKYGSAPPAISESVEVIELCAATPEEDSEAVPFK